MFIIFDKLWIVNIYDYIWPYGATALRDIFVENMPMKLLSLFYGIKY